MLLDPGAADLLDSLAVAGLLLAPFGHRVVAGLRLRDHGEGGRPGGRERERRVGAERHPALPAADAKHRRPALVAVVADAKVKARGHLVGILDALAADGAGVLDKQGGEAFDRHGSPARVRVCRVPKRGSGRGALGGYYTVPLDSTEVQVAAIAQ